MLNLSRAVRSSLDDGGTALAIAFEGREYDWAWVRRAVGLIDDAITAAGLEGRAAGLVARNRPGHVAALAAQLAARRTTCMIYSAQSPERIARDITDMAAPIVIADAQDWTTEAVTAAAQTGVLGIVLAADAAAPVHVHPELAAACPTSIPARSADVAAEMLTSGTTGAPKRVPLRWDTIERATEDARAVYAGVANLAAPQLMLHALGHISGISFLGPALAFRQPICLLEKFTVEGWTRAVERYRPVRSSLPPAAVRMILDAEVPSSRLASLELVVVGGARIEPALRDAFEARYGIPVLLAFGATEFGGVIASWTLDLYREYGAAKRESVGRPAPGVTFRIAAPESGGELPVGATGLLQARVDRLGPDWIGTTDLASIDADGFLYLHGRADGAINRGGFKVLPEVVEAALRTHPAIADAAVVALPDERLGEVPAAAVELRPDATPPAEEELIAFLRSRLLAYQVPVRIRIADALPRNASLKPSMRDVRAFLEAV